MSRRDLIQWSPFMDIDRFFEEEMWPSAGFMPAADIYQNKNNVIVEMAVPKIDADKINISIENDVLTVSGRRDEKKEVKKEDYYREEIREGSF